MLTGTGVWTSELRYGDRAEGAEAAAELEELGYAAVWVPDVGGNLFGALDRLHAATSSITIATGILNIWMQEATATNAWWEGLGEAERARTLLGLGVSHGPFIGEKWRKPLSVMRDYLDAVDVPADHLCLAALGPKMLELSRTRTAGAHPYLVTPEHTAQAREALGPDALLAPEQGVVLDTDADAARAVARQMLAGYAQMPNYANNWRRLGFSEADVTGLSDGLVDALVVHGDVDAIAARVGAHRDAGADHVCIQVITAQGAPMPREAWRALAGV